MRSWWSTKSNSASNAPLAYGIAEVVSPRGLTYRVACHQWLTSGAWAIRTLPMIWVHMCTVSRVSGQSDSVSRGHPADRRTWSAVTRASHHCCGGRSLRSLKEDLDSGLGLRHHRGGGGRH